MVERTRRSIFVAAQESYTSAEGSGGQLPSVAEKFRKKPSFVTDLATSPSLQTARATSRVERGGKADVGLSNDGA